MPTPYDYDYRVPLEVPDAKGDLEFIREVAEDAIGEGEHSGLFPLASIADGEVTFVPMDDGGYAVTIGPTINSHDSGQDLEATTSSRTLVFDSSLRVVRAVVEVGSDLIRERGQGYTKRVPKSAASAFVMSIATSIRDEL